MEWIDRMVGFVVGIIIMKWLTLYMLRGYEVIKVKSKSQRSAIKRLRANEALQEELDSYDLKEISKVDDFIVGRFYFIQNKLFKELTIIRECVVSEGHPKHFASSGGNIWLDKDHEKEVTDKYTFKLLPSFPNLKFKI